MAASMILKCCVAVVLLGNDVVNLEPQPLQRGHSTVFAMAAGSLPNKLFQFAIHRSPHAEAFRRNSRALDFTNSIKHPTCR